MGYVNYFVFGVLLGSRLDITWENSPCLGHRREGAHASMLHWELALQQAVALSKEDIK